MQNAEDGALDQLRADQQDHRRDGQSREILDPVIAVGVRVVRRLGRQLEAHQRYNGAGRVGEVVDGVRRDGDAPGERPGEKLPGAQQHVDQNTDQPGKLSVLRAHLRRLCVRRIFNKKPQKQLRHDHFPFSRSPAAASCRHSVYYIRKTRRRQVILFSD